MEKDLGIQELIRDWEGLGVMVRYDETTETWIFIALHDDSLGPALGGSRIKVYPSPVDGLRDAMRLAEGMTDKWAAIDAGYGGGKAVLALSSPLDPAKRHGLLERYANLLNTLNGAFSTGQDLGTTTDDIAFLADRSPYIHGSRAGEPVEDPSPYTARGVLLGMRVAVRHLNNGEGLGGATVLVQGAGSVGSRLARLVASDGGRVIVADTNEQRSVSVADEVGGRAVSPEDVYVTDCDIYSPCAVGGTLNQDTIPRLRCRIVAGSANNQLAEPEDAVRLHERGILYAPDYVINAGGAIALGPLIEAPDEERNRRVDGIEDALTEIFELATDHDESPAAAARRRVERVLQAARKDAEG